MTADRAVRSGMFCAEIAWSTLLGICLISDVWYVDSYVILVTLLNNLVASSALEQRQPMFYTPRYSRQCIVPPILYPHPISILQASTYIRHPSRNHRKHWHPWKTTGRHHLPAITRPHSQPRTSPPSPDIRGSANHIYGRTRHLALDVDRPLPVHLACCASRMFAVHHLPLFSSCSRIEARMAPTF